MYDYFFRLEEKAKQTVEDGKLSNEGTTNMEQKLLFFFFLFWSKMEEKEWKYLLVFFFIPRSMTVLSQSGPVSVRFKEEKK